MDIRFILVLSFLYMLLLKVFIICRVLIILMKGRTEVTGAGGTVDIVFKIS